MHRSWFVLGGLFVLGLTVHVFAQDADPIAAFRTPAFAQWMNEVAALPSDDQVEAVGRKLKELNPHFEAEVLMEHWTEAGVVTALYPGGDNLVDVSPVRALTELKSLSCRASDRGKLKLSNLSPLAGMSLESLDLSGTHVSDLSALAGCKKLEYLNVVGTKVTPAAVAALQKALPDCDIEWDEPLKPIKTFSEPAFQQWAKDVAGLPADEQMKAVAKKLEALNPHFEADGLMQHKIDNGVVTELDLYTHTIADLSPLRALTGLKRLAGHGCDRTNRYALYDLSPLRGMALTDLDFSWTKVADLSPLAGLPLTTLNCSWTKVSDLSPLRGLPLTELHCSVSDLSPLKGMKLASLDCSCENLSDLSPLEGMPLTKLVCRWSKVSDLSPLCGMPLTELDLGDSRISDLAPLANCQRLKLLTITATRVTPTGVAALQRALPHCEIDWDQPAKASEM